MTKHSAKIHSQPGTCGFRWRVVYYRDGRWWSIDVLTGPQRWVTWRVRRRLEALRRYDEAGARSITIPCLGCGHVERHDEDTGCVRTSCPCTLQEAP